MSRFLLVCLGGALGTGARYLIGVACTARLGSAFPTGTLLVNVLGCFLISLIAQMAAHSPLMTPTLRLFLTTGCLGGFTTYSAFNYETLRYVETGAYGLACGYGAATVLLCLGAGVLGALFGHVLWA